jgi:hypothetical protein
MDPIIVIHVVNSDLVYEGYREKKMNKPCREVITVVMTILNLSLAKVF